MVDQLLVKMRYAPIRLLVLSSTRKQRSKEKRTRQALQKEFS